MEIIDKYINVYFISWEECWQERFYFFVFVLTKGMLRNPDSIDEILVGNGEPLPAFAFAFT